MYITADLDQGKFPVKLPYRFDSEEELKSNLDCAKKEL
jgi:hypothetical protein